MAKYQALGIHLRRQAADRVPMRFSEIERVIGTKLPRSAHLYRAWWSNNPHNSVMTRAWLEAGFRSELVDMEAKRLVFARIEPKQGTSRQGTSGMSGHAGAFKNEKHNTGHPLLGALKGTFALDASLDLTQPAMPEWASLIDETIADEKKS